MNGVLGSSVLVSIPGSALDALDLPGSIFEWHHLRDALLPPELHRALLLVTGACAAQGVALRFVARPEIFTSGAARAWLDARLGGTLDHLALTDGHALRVLPGLRNHMFFYARGGLAGEAALCRLAAIVPELFAALASQVNGALAVRLGARWVRPPLLSLRFAAAPPADAGLRAPFQAEPRPQPRDAAASAEAAVAAEAAPPAGRPLHYVPLSEAALADAAFVAALARMVQQAVVGSGTEAMLLGLPRLDGKAAEPGGSGTAELREQIAAVLTALGAAGVLLPRARSWGVRFASGDPTPEELAGGRITLHPGTDFWRFAPGVYDAVAEVRAMGGGSLAPFHRLVAAWLGRAVTLARPAPILPALPSVAP